MLAGRRRIGGAGVSPVTFARTPSTAGGHTENTPEMFVLRTLIPLTNVAALNPYGKQPYSVWANILWMPLRNGV
jgi:hypothetical protein